MSFSYEPAAATIAEVAAALGLPEDGMLRRSFAEGWYGSLLPRGNEWVFRTDDLPPDVLGSVLQWLAWGRKIPPQACETDPWGEPFHYDRWQIWRAAASLAPRLRERGRIRASAVALTERLYMDSGDGEEFPDVAARVAELFRDDSDLVFRIEGVTARQVEAWSLGAAGKPGARRYHPSDWPAVLAPRQDESEDLPLPRWAWESFAILLLDPDTRYATAEAYESICAMAKRRKRSLPPLDAFERRARREFDRDLREAAWLGMKNAVAAHLEWRSRPAEAVDSGEGAL